MKKNISLFVICSISLLVSTSVLAGRIPPCKEPGISRIFPDKTTAVLPGSEYSFIAARGVKTREIQVMIKGKVVAHKIEKLLPDVYKVSGIIPADTPPGYASAKIEVGSIRGECPVKKAWLMFLKNADSAESTQAEDAAVVEKAVKKPAVETAIPAAN